MTFLFINKGDMKKKKRFSTILRKNTLSLELYCMLSQRAVMNSKSKLCSSNQTLTIFCSCIATILTIIGITILIKALAHHSHANEYDIEGECTVIDMNSEQIITCDTSLQCAIEILWTYYYTTDHKQCAQKIKNREDNLGSNSETNSDSENFKITSTEQLDNSLDRSFYIGAVRTCYTNSVCDNVYFTSKFNKHHVNAIGSYIGCIVLQLISCCCICCAIQVCRISKKQRAIQRLSRLNSIKIYDKYTFCIDNMLRISYKNEYGYNRNMKYIQILPLDIKQLICQFVEMKKDKNKKTTKKKKVPIVIIQKTKEEMELLNDGEKLEDHIQMNRMNDEEVS